MGKPHIVQVEVPETPEASEYFEMSLFDFDGEIGGCKKWGNISIFFGNTRSTSCNSIYRA